MRFSDVDILGVYVAPISVMLVEAWIVLIVLRRVADRLGVMQHVWHPALFTVSVYVILLSALVLFHVY